MQNKIDKLEQFFIRKQPWPESVEWSELAPRFVGDDLVMDEGDWIITYEDGTLQVVKCDSFEKFANEVIKRLQEKK